MYIYICNFDEYIYIYIYIYLCIRTYIYIYKDLFHNLNVLEAQSEQMCFCSKCETNTQHVTRLYLNLDLKRAMEHPIIHRLLRKGFESTNRDAQWGIPAFLETYFTTVAMVSSFLEYVHALDLYSALPAVGNLQELVSMFQFELVQCLGDCNSVPVFQREDPDEGWWLEITRLQLENYLSAYINLFATQSDMEKAKMNKHVNAMKAQFEFCTRISDDELWTDLWQWSKSLGSLDQSIAWDERPFPRMHVSSQPAGQ